MFPMQRLHCRFYEFVSHANYKLTFGFNHSIKEHILFPYYNEFYFMIIKV